MEEVSPRARMRQGRRATGHGGARERAGGALCVCAAVGAGRGAHRPLFPGPAALRLREGMRGRPRTGGRGACRRPVASELSLSRICQKRRVRPSKLGSSTNYSRSSRQRSSAFLEFLRCPPSACSPRLLSSARRRPSRRRCRCARRARCEPPSSWQTRRRPPRRRRRPLPSPGCRGKAIPLVQRRWRTAR